MLFLALRFGKASPGFAKGLVSRILGSSAGSIGSGKVFLRFDFGFGVPVLLTGLPRLFLGLPLPLLGSRGEDSSPPFSGIFVTIVSSFSPPKAWLLSIGFASKVIRRRHGLHSSSPLFDGSLEGDGVEIKNSWTVELPDVSAIALRGVILEARLFDGEEFTARFSPDIFRGSGEEVIASVTEDVDGLVVGSKAVVYA